MLIRQSMITICRYVPDFVVKGTHLQCDELNQAAQVGINIMVRTVKDVINSRGPWMLR